MSDWRGCVRVCVRGVGRGIWGMKRGMEMGDGE